MVLDRVLSCDYQKRLRQRKTLSINCDLAFVHGLEQRRLGLRGGAVDLVCQQNVSENRAALKFKFLLSGGINRDANDVRGQHVTGELDALKTASEGPRQRMGQSGLTDAGNALNQEMPAGEHGNQRQSNDFILAANDFF